MTQTVERSDRAAAAPLGDPIPKRRFTSRLSLGHLIMVVAGLTAFVLVLTVLRDRSEIVQVAVASSDIQVGTRASSQLFELVGVSGSDGILDQLVTVELLASLIESGEIATENISRGEPITASSFDAASEAAQIRAMSIPVNPAHAVAGALAEGDVIDLIVVDDGVARYIATSLDVIGVSADIGGIGGSSAMTITVAVDVELSLRVASALNSGSLEIVRANGSEPAPIDGFYDPRPRDESG